MNGCQCETVGPSLSGSPRSHGTVLQVAQPAFRVVAGWALELCVPASRRVCLCQEHLLAREVSTGSGTALERKRGSTDLDVGARPAACGFGGGLARGAAAG